MPLRSLIVALIATACCFSAAAVADPVHQTLDGPWELLQEGKSQSYPATVPGCVHTDLLAAKAIPDPFWRENEKQLQWISSSGWTYTRRFTASAELLKCAHLELRCEGLETLATVRLNDKPLGFTDNMFRTWTFDVHGLVHEGENTLQISFAPLKPYIEQQVRDNKGPGMAVGGISEVRVEPCANGWDFGPKFLTFGIWRPIELIGWDAGRITDVAVVADLHDAEHVTAGIHVATTASSGEKLKASATVSLGGKVIATAEGDVNGDQAQITVPISDAQRWWPNGMGAHPMYDVAVELRSAEGAAQDHFDRRFGLRTIGLVPKTATTPLGITVNGKPFFAMGASWIPCDIFPNWTTAEKLRHYIADAASAHMNMLRSWGGGYYEDDAFYDACDEAGMLVWMDFKFACAAYPAADPKFMANVKAEAEENIRRLRNHPSIAVWSGNNEVKGLVDHYKVMREVDYDHLFHDLLRQEVSTLVPGAAYVPGSPESGDDHNWWVWHIGAMFEKYRESHGLMTEFGFQSFPCPATVDTYTEPADRSSVLSEVMKFHQRNGNKRGNEMIVEQMGKYFQPAKDFDSTLWLSQINQAYGMEVGIEHWRSDWPNSTGSLVWQYDDIWPGPTWSAVDYFGRWKALMYHLRHAYSPLMVTAIADAKQQQARVKICSSLAEPVHATLRWDCTDAGGKMLDAGSANIDVPRGTASVDGPTIDLAGALKQVDQGNLLLWVHLEVDGREESAKLITCVYPKDLPLADPELAATVEPAGDGFDVTIQAQHPALWTWVELAGDPDARYSDNFVSMRGDKRLAIHLVPTKGQSVDEVRKGLSVHSLFDTYTNHAAASAGRAGQRQS